MTLLFWRKYLNYLMFKWDCLILFFLSSFVESLNNYVVSTPFLIPRLTDMVDLSVWWWMSVGDTLWSLSWLNICPFLHGAWQWCIIHCESELPHVGFVYPPCCVLSHHLSMRTESNRGGKKGFSLLDTKRVILGSFHLSFIGQNVGQNRK